ncbi:MAG: BrnT family toxin, partial [Vulcanimicrobiaceae bacterium]
FDEQRFVTIGSDSDGRVLVVVNSYPDDSEELRIISVRKATPHERRQYSEEN